MPVALTARDRDRGKQISLWEQVTRDHEGRAHRDLRQRVHVCSRPLAYETFNHPWLREKVPNTPLEIWHLGNSDPIDNAFFDEIREMDKKLEVPPNARRTRFTHDNWWSETRSLELQSRQPPNFTAWE